MGTLENIILVAAVVGLSAIAMSMTTSGLNVDFELLENTDQCISDCYLRFKFKTDRDVTVNLKKIFTKGRDALDLLDSGFRILKNTTHNETKWDPDIICFPYKIKLPANASYPGGMRILYDNCTDYGFWNSTEIVREKYVDFNPRGKTIKANRWYTIELWGKKKFKFGENNIDAVPCIGNFCLPFAWWNSNFNYRYPILANATTVYHPISANDTYKIGGNTPFWTQNSTETIYVYCENSGCATGFVAIANETDEKSWENETSREGNDVTAIWGADALGVYHFGEATGTSVNDSSGNTDGETYGSPTWNDSGRFGYGMNFDNTDDYVNLTVDFGDPAGSSGFTMSVWAWANAWAQAPVNYDWLVCRDDNSINVPYSQGVDATPNVHFQMRIGGSFNDWDATTAVVRTNEWVYIVVTYNASHVNAFVNGTLMWQTADSGNLDGGLLTVPAMIGAQMRSGSPYGFFNGIIDEVRVLTRSMTAEEIKDNWINGIGDLALLGTEESGLPPVCWTDLGNIILIPPGCTYYTQDGRIG